MRGGGKHRCRACMAGCLTMRFVFRGLSCLAGRRALGTVLRSTHCMRGRDDSDQMHRCKCIGVEASCLKLFILHSDVCGVCVLQVFVSRGLLWTRSVTGMGGGLQAPRAKALCAVREPKAEDRDVYRVVSCIADSVRTSTGCVRLRAGNSARLAPRTAHPAGWASLDLVRLVGAVGGRTTVSYRPERGRHASVSKRFRRSELHCRRHQRVLVLVDQRRELCWPFPLGGCPTGGKWPGCLSLFKGSCV